MVSHQIIDYQSSNKQGKESLHICACIEQNKTHQRSQFCCNKDLKRHQSNKINKINYTRNSITLDYCCKTHNQIQKSREGKSFLIVAVNMAQTHKSNIGKYFKLTMDLIGHWQYLLTFDDQEINQQLSKTSIYDAKPKICNSQKSHLMPIKTVLYSLGKHIQDVIFVNQYLRLPSSFQ